MKPTEFAIVLLLGLAAQAASSFGEPGGRWRTSDAPDEMKAGVVFPDFSENDFVGMFLRCVRDGGSVEFSVDSRDKMKTGDNARVTDICRRRRKNVRRPRTKRADGRSDTHHIHDRQSRSTGGGPETREASNMR